MDYKSVIEMSAKSIYIMKNMHFSSDLKQYWSSMQNIPLFSCPNYMQQLKCYAMSLPRTQGTSVHLWNYRSRKRVPLK